MKERIRIIMENEHLTPSAFADMIQIGRAVMSHILNGRNNPSLDVVTRILYKLPHINSSWLLTGEGNMYNTNVSPSNNITNVNNDNNEKTSSSNSFDLFSLNAINSADGKEEIKYEKENTVKSIENDTDSIIKQQVIYQKAPDKKITKIIIYYSDNTFETFEADNRPL